MAHELDETAIGIAEVTGVIVWMYVTGEADFVLICVAPDMAAFEALTQRLFFENRNVRRFRTSVVMGRTKVGLSVPV